MTALKPEAAELIRVRVLVQGVGFRPTVWRLASRYGLPASRPARTEIGGRSTAPDGHQNRGRADRVVQNKRQAEHAAVDLEAAGGNHPRVS